MKQCSKCKQTKQRTSEFFNKKSSASDGFNSWCKVCRRTHYHKMKNTDEYIQTYKRAKASKQERALKFYSQIVSDGECMDCGEEDSRVLEFDHVRGVKKAGVAQLVYSGYSNKSLQSEIDKCDLVCLNCHLLRTTDRMVVKGVFLDRVLGKMKDLVEFGIDNYLESTSRTVKTAVIKLTKFSSYCMDCAEDRPRILEFDHVFGNKLGEVSWDLECDTSVSVLDLLQEIDKCEVVCRNCHKKRTLDRKQKTT